MTPKQLVGRKVREAREAAGMDQAVLGSLLGDYLSENRKAWSKQQVSAAEQGHRAIDVAELLVFAIVLARPFHWFFLPPTVDGEDGIDLPGGRVQWTELRRSSAFGHLGAMAFQAQQIEQDLRRLREQLEEGSE